MKYHTLFFDNKYVEFVLLKGEAPLLTLIQKVTKQGQKLEISPLVSISFFMGWVADVNHANLSKNWSHLTYLIFRTKSTKKDRTTESHCQLCQTLKGA